MELIIYDDTANKRICKIIEIYDENNFKINKDLEGDIVFVYGSVVEDFHIMNKEYINCVNISASQELHRKIEAQHAKISELENTIAGILARLEDQYYRSQMCIINCIFFHNIILVSVVINILEDYKHFYENCIMLIWNRRT